MHFHPLLASSIILQPDQATITGLCKTPFKGHKDGCPNYNSNWSCPPNAPKFDETAAKILNFKTFWLVSIVIPIPQRKLRKIFTNIGAKNAAAIQTLYLNHFLDFVKEQSKTSAIFHASHCTLCNERGFKGCSFPNSPCRFPDKMRVSPEAGGIDLFQTMKKAGVKFEMNPKTYITRVGLIASDGSLNINQIFAEFNLKFAFC